MRKYFATLHVLIATFSIMQTNVAGFERLGKLSPSVGTTVLGGKFPQTAVMYNHFIKPGKPLLMKAVLEETMYPAFLDWTDEYLKEKFWDDVVTIWTGNPPAPAGLTLSQFVEQYQDLGYAVSHYMPEKMKAETLIPPVLQCGGIQDNLHSPGLFFSSGGDKTLLHYNDVDSLTCLLDGGQEFVLFDKENKELIEETGWVEEGGYSLVDVEDVDKRKFPGLYTAPWQKATVAKGDCLLVPYGWYQHISTQIGRTLAIVLKFSHLWWFDKEECDNRDKNETLKSVSEFNILDDVGELRTALLAPFSNRSSVPKDAFQQTVDCGSPRLTEQFWSYIDRNNDGSLSWPELYNFDMNYNQNKFHGCYRNLKRVRKDQRLVFNSSREKAYDTIKSERLKAVPGKERTEDDFTDRKKKMDKELADRGAGKIVKDDKESVSVKTDKDRKDNDKEGKPRHEEF